MQVQGNPVSAMRNRSCEQFSPLQTLGLLLIWSVVALPATAQKQDQQPRYQMRIVPHEGQPIIANAPVITQEGITFQTAAPPAEREERSLSWYDIASSTVVPPISFEGDLTTLVIDDDSRDRVTSNFGKIKLRKGFQRFHLLYASKEDATVADRVLQLDYKGPKQSAWSEVPETMLKHQPHWYWPKENKSPGFDDEGFRLPETPLEVKSNISARVHCWTPFGNVPKRPEDLRQVNLHHYGSIPKVRPPDGRTLAAETGVVLYGLFDVPADGEYRFRLKSDGIASLVFGDYSPRFGQIVLKEEGDEWDADLAYGGRIAAPVTAFSDDIITFAPRHGGSKSDETSIAVPIPRNTIVEMVRRVDGVRTQLPAEPRSETDDVVFAEGSSGAVRGVVGKAIAIRDDKLVFLYEGEEREVSLDRVKGIRFAKSEYTSGRPPTKPVQMVGIVGIHAVPAVLVGDSNHWIYKFKAIGFPEDQQSTADNTFELSLVTLRGIDIYGGGAIGLLDLPPEIVATPLFDLPPPVAFGQLPDGKPLSIGRTKFQKGFAAGPKTSIAFLTGGSFRTLKISVGLASEGAASVRLLADGEPIWANEALKIEDGVVEVQSNIQGKDELKFEVDFGPDFDVNDIVVFGDPELVRGPPAEEVAAVGGSSNE